MNTINNIEDYYFDKNAFILKSKWSKRVKTVITSVIICSLLLVDSDQHKLFDLVDQKHSFKEAALITYVKQENANLSYAEAAEIVLTLKNWSEHFDKPIELLLAIGKVESEFNPFAISSAGAFGLMQVIPKWHLDKIKKARTELGTPELFNINNNTYLGTWILSDCVERHKDLNKSLLCYNGSLNNPNGYDQKVISAKNDIVRFTTKNM